LLPAAVPRPDAALARPHAPDLDHAGRADAPAGGRRPRGRAVDDGFRAGGIPDGAGKRRGPRIPMTPIPAPSFLPVDWWSLGAVIALSAGVMLLLLLELVPSRPGSARAPWITLATLAVSAWS